MCHNKIGRPSVPSMGSHSRHCNPQTGQILTSKAACPDPLPAQLYALCVAHPTSTGLFGAANVLVEMEDVLRVVELLNLH